MHMRAIAVTRNESFEASLSRQAEQVYCRLLPVEHLLFHGSYSSTYQDTQLYSDGCEVREACNFVR